MAGLPFIRTLILAPIQGTVVLGMQGIGCSLPLDAAVAAATMGFANDLHCPKDFIFTIGL